MIVNVGPELLEDSKQRLEKLIENKIASRIFEQDSSIWGLDAQPEASIRLGWTAPIETANALIPAILKLRDEFRAQGITRVVLCGMGGSSLAPEVICKAEQVELLILDSTSPTSVRKALNQLEITAVVVSSKSGSTVETDSQKRIFEQAFEQAGIDPSSRMVIVTDPNSPLMEDGKSKGYTVFEADPNVGGRYSALTAFGLVPSGLAGANIAKMISDANTALPYLAEDSSDNPALVIAAAMTGVRSRLVIDDSRGIPGFADWSEQLIAESTGKEGKGILPVAGNPEAEISAGAENVLPALVSSARGEGDGLNVSGNLAELFLAFEVATAASGWLLGINPFDQPDVESAKNAARESLQSIKAESNFDSMDLAREALKEISADGYLSIQLYADRRESPEIEKLRQRFVKISEVPVTIGWGPRFLHSTGQFHKGGTPGGVFIQLIQDDLELEIPGRDFGFQKLIESQAAGDAKVLKEKGNRVVRLKVSETDNVIDMLEKLVD